MDKRIKELSDEAGLFWQFSPAYEKCLEHFAKLVRADEREACAVLCEEQDEYGCGQYAKAIRARGNHER